MGIFVSLAALSAARGQGAAYAWGRNYSGQLGNNSSQQDSASPVAVTGLNAGVIGVAGGGEHSLALRDGAVYAWGSYAYGQLGNGQIDGDPSTNSSHVPVAVTGLSSGVTSVAAGANHSLAIQNGAAYAWGRNTVGQLGDGTETNRAVPMVVTNLSDGVTAVAGGGGHSLAIQNGGAYAWGTNYYGQLGNASSSIESTTPVAVKNLSSGVTAVAGGGLHSLAIQNGAVYAWGFNGYGQLGNDSTTDSRVPVAIPSLSSGVTAIAAGDYHSLAVQNGNVFTWGNGQYGQLGNGMMTDSHTPIQIDPANLKDIVAVTACTATSYALAADGSLWVWGRDEEGQLGIGSFTNYPTPRHLLPPSGYHFTAIRADGSGNHAVAILTATGAAPNFFDGQVALNNGVYFLQFPNGNPFGYFSYLTDPKYLYHFDLGYEYVFDANDGKAGVYLYDFKSQGFFYTSPTFPFPYLYDFSLNTVLYYYPDPSNPGHYNTDGYRFFYRFDNGQIIVK